MQISDHEVLKDRISVLPYTVMEVMSMDNMTALVSAFARAHHYRNNHTWVFADPIAENAFIVPNRALRAEGTSYHYLPASRYIELDEEPIHVIEDTFRKQGLPFVTCTTWSTDGFFRETKDMVKYRLEEGCSVVEMECAALAACARKRGASFGQFLFTADSLANVHEYDARDFGMESHEKALLLGLDILKNYRRE